MILFFQIGMLGLPTRIINRCPNCRHPLMFTAASLKFTASDYFALRATIIMQSGRLSETSTYAFVFVLYYLFKILSLAIQNCFFFIQFIRLYQKYNAGM